MNPRMILICILLAVSFYSCNKDYQERKVTCLQSDVYDYLDRYKNDSVCSSEICMNYLKIWEELLKERNDIGDTFFDRHVILSRSGMDTWKQGTTFRVCYKIQIDWATAYVCDKFLVRINSESYLYPGLPRDEYLSKDEIRSALDQDQYHSRIRVVSLQV